MRGLLISWLAFGLFACSTTQVSIDVLQPPDQQLELEARNVGVINRVNYDKAPTRYYINGQLAKEYFDFNERVGDEAVVGLARALNEAGYFEAGLISRKKLPAKGEFVGPPVLINRLQEVCQSESVEALIALEGYQATIDSDGSVTYSSAVDRNYGTVQVPLFDGNQTVRVGLFFRIYDCEVGGVFEGQVEEQSQTQARGETPAQVQYQMPDKESSLLVTARDAGKSFARYISPYWKTETRTLYAYGSNKLVEAGNLALGGNWPAAVDIWFELSKFPQRSVASKATYNMIVASEMAGDIDLAISWAQQTVDRFRLKRGARYLEQLQARKAQLTQLNFIEPTSEDK